MDICKYPVFLNVNRNWYNFHSYKLERNDNIQLTMLIRSANAELKKTDVLVAVDLNATSTQFLTLSLNHYLNHTFVCKPHLSLKVADR